MTRLPPSFLITIDTEGDDLWSCPREVTTRNAKYIDRFQNLCETWGFKPTYLTDFEMAISPEFVVFGKQVLNRRVGEVGMHLHAWNTPPIVSLTADDCRHLPYLIEFDEAVLRSKVAFMTGLLEDTFEIKMTSHRAGQWAFNATHASALHDEGYLVDCSVTPHKCWKRTLGDSKDGGFDYHGFPTHPYRLDLTDISRQGTARILEVPMTVRPAPLAGTLPVKALRRLRVLPGADKLFRRLTRGELLRPNGHNLEGMLTTLDWVVDQGFGCAEFMLHSSELMPGGSPRFRTADQIETLYKHLEVLFRRAAESFTGQTLTEFYYGHIGDME